METSTNMVLRGTYKPPTEIPVSYVILNVNDDLNIVLLEGNFSANSEQNTVKLKFSMCF